MSRLPCKGLIYLLPILVFIFVFSAFRAFSQTSPVGIDTIQPQKIYIDSFFSGQKVAVRAMVPFGAKVVLRLLGPRENLALMKKGRVGGLWMNVEQVHFQSVPKVYLLWTSEKLSALGTRDSLKAMKLDYLSLLSGTLQNKKNRGEESLLVSELIKLKEADKVYHIFEGAVQIKPWERRVWDQADAVLELPSKIYPGIYTLELIAFKEGKGRLVHASTIEVKLAGFPALVSNLAARKGLLYGTLAVIIATFSGLMIGIVFSSRGGH